MSQAMRLIDLFPLLGAAWIAALPAAAQQEEFTWMQCNGRSAEDCNRLMGSLKVPLQKREEVLLARATLLLQGHDLEGAIAEYREVTIVNPASALAYSNRGILEGYANDWPDAAQHLRRALALAPQQTDLRPMLIVALAKSGDCPAAKQELRETQTRTPAVLKLDEAEKLLPTLCH
jgi:tetratricopeptide (TPR) repeat protein